MTSSSKPLNAGNGGRKSPVPIQDSMAKGGCFAEWFYHQAEVERRWFPKDSLEPQALDSTVQTSTAPNKEPDVPYSSIHSLI